MILYNEHDKKTAAWLRELIKEGRVFKGAVDERDIQDVKANDLAGLRQFHAFAGIGGWPYALWLAGWPEDREVWTGSCPCQPFSVASPRRKGVEDPRHLWPVFRDLIAKRKPATIFGEQVASPDGRDWLAGVSSDLEALGYRFGAADLCAAGVGAPQIRQRLYWVADCNGYRSQGRHFPPPLPHAKHTPRLGQIVFAVTGYATPLANRLSRTPGKDFAPNLAAQAERMVGYATPNTWDCQGSMGGGQGSMGGGQGSMGGGQGSTGGGQGASLRTDSQLMIHGNRQRLSDGPTEPRGALNPDLARWLMGFPAAWGSCGATVMLSSRKSRRRS